MAFSKLKQNWDSYNADEISLNSIITAHKIPMKFMYSQ